ncbi:MULTISPECIES: FAD-binding oxidoreductase [unclassified Stenotrophomonas]|uniref:FAD-dependent oxidoreductase n=1 Tax=unclassified Stenotrophomonas TaxID=196198 RepID=UPI00211757C3|nr:MULTISPECIES: FAD-binding oxidoreductase [unclassified Stenotrophomonas]
MKRRDCLKASLALPLLPLVLKAAAAPANAWARARPGGVGWPAATDWEQLSRAVGGRLSVPQSPFLGDATTRAEGMAQIQNPFYIGDQPGLTQTSGYFGAWRSVPSAQMVAARDSADVAAAVNFARRHRLRLVVKGGGHSYHGTSCAPDSLLVWTRAMKQVQLHDAFVPQGARPGTAPQPAVSVGAGAMWIDAYDAVTTQGGRYVQGGGCTSVGVTGLVTGGGFGSFSKAFGTAAASLLEAEVVTADGEVRVVNADHEPELFWALKGGCAASFGIITRMTLKTHALPRTFGGISLKVQAGTETAWRALAAQVLRFYRDALCNPHWGEQITFGGERVLSISMVFQGLDRETAEATWQPLLAWIQARADYTVREPLQALAMPARDFWNADFFRQHAPQIIAEDTRDGAPPTHMLWKGDQGQVGWFLHGYASAWLPSALLGEDRIENAADALCAAAEHMDVGLHCNKGLFGAPADALAASAATATHPAVLDAFALALIGNAGGPVYPGCGGAVNAPEARHGALRVSRAYTALGAVAPQAPTYVSECDYFQKDWQQAFWGPHYPRLLAAKRRYDPDGLFVIHHGVGSEAWSSDGFERRAG